MKKIAIPKFATEEEEATWWERNPEAATEIMAAALNAGRVRRGPARTITMRLPEADIHAAKILAERKGVPYQTYIKMLLHEALEKERQAS